MPFESVLSSVVYNVDVLREFFFNVFVCLNKNRSIVEKHEQLLEDNTKQETTLVVKRTQRDAYVYKFN